jgi:hypothetical protein
MCWICSRQFQCPHWLFQAGAVLKKEKKMNTVELVQFSLGSAFDVLGMVTAVLTQEQADWTPPGVASTIGAIYWHIIAYVDHFAEFLYRAEYNPRWRTGRGQDAARPRGPIRVARARRSS